MSLSSAKAKLDAQGGDPVTGYISKTDHQESYDELVDDTALTGATTAEALDVTGALTAGTIASDSTVAGTGLAGGLLSSANPVMDSSAAPGTSAIPSRQDHVHPSDTTKVTGPASATDNALARFDGTTGKAVQNSGITVDDSGNITSDVTIGKADATLTVGSGSGGGIHVVKGAAGQSRQVRMLTGTSRRWDLGANTTAEGGSSAGSDFVLTSHSDGGTQTAVVLATRSTGKVTLGAVGATAGLELGTSGPRVMSGTGSPEGVVTAPVGSRWIRTDGGALGDFEYQKRSGTGNTGWVVADGDTGWRDVNSLLVNGWTRTGEFLVRRTGNRVSVWASFLVGTSASADAFATLPSGFRAKATNAVPVLSSGTTVQQFVYNGSGVLSSSARTSTYYADWSWLTNDPWPTSLPGSAA